MTMADFSYEDAAKPATSDFSYEDAGGAPAPASTTRRLGDIAIAGARGVIGAPELATGISNIVTGGRTGQALGRIGVRFKDAKDVLTGFQSDEQKAADQAVADAKGFFPTAAAMVENPSTIASGLAESVPVMLAGGAVSRGMMAAAPAMNPITAGAVGEATASAGSTAEQVRQETRTGFLTPSQAALAAGSGALTGVLGRASGAVANKLGIGDVNTALATGKLGAVGAEAAAKGAEKGVARRVGEGLVNEGVLQELPQSMQEQAAQNLALDKPVGEGVLEAGAQGMMVGALTGGGVAAVSGTEAAPNPTSSTEKLGVLKPTVPKGGVSPSETGGGYSTADQPIPTVPPAEQPAAQSRSASMGIDPNAGALSQAAAITVDSGADVITQAQEQAKVEAEQQAKEKAKPGKDGKTPPPEPAAPLVVPPADPSVPITGPFTQAIHGGAHATPPTQPAPIPAEPAAPTAVDIPAADSRAAAGAVADQGPQGAGTVPDQVSESTPGAVAPTTQESSNASEEAGGREGRTPEAPAAEAQGRPTGEDARRPDDAVDPGGDGSSAPAASPGQPAGSAPVQGNAQAQRPAPTEPVDLGAHTAATSPHNDLPEPSQAQKEAGNYKKAHIVMGGLDISIENPEGSTRSGTDADGKPWSNTMTGHYGYIKQTTGSDGEQHDVYVKPGTPLDSRGTVYVVDQIDPRTGKHDEHKSMIGYASPMEARKAYQSNYAKGWNGLKNITPMAWDEFKAWVRNGTGDATTAAAADLPVATAAPAPAVQAPAGGPGRTTQAAVATARAPEAVGVGVKDSGASRDGSRGPAFTPEAMANYDAIRSLEQKARGRADQRFREEFGGRHWQERRNKRGQERFQALLAEELERRKGQMDKLQRERARLLGESKPANSETEMQNGASTTPVPASEPPQPASKAKKSDPTGPARRAAWEKNPLLSFLAKHGLFHVKGDSKSLKTQFSPDRQLMVPGYGPVFRSNGQQDLDHLAALATQDGFLPAAADGEELTQLIERAVRGERVAPVYSEDGAQSEIERRIAAMDDMAQLRDNEFADLDDAMFGPSTMTEEDAMRALGFSDQEIADDIASRSTTPQQGGEGRAQPDAPEAAAAQPSPERGAQAQGPAAAAPAEEGLTAPTPDEIRARADAAQAAAAADAKEQKRLADKAKADAERGEYTLTGSDRAADVAAAAGQQDIFSAPAEPAPKAKPAVSANTLFTSEAADAARARLKAKLGRLNSGIDPETMLDGILLAGYHIERGARTFAAYAKAMVEDLGDAAKPYLRSWYMGVKYDPRAGTFAGDMDSAQAMEQVDLDNLDGAPAAPAATQGAQDAPDTDIRVERDRPVASPEPAVERPVPAGPGSPDGRPAGARSQPDPEGGRPQSSPQLPADSTAAGGERGNLDLFGGEQSVQPTLFDAGIDDGERGGDSGIAGVPPESIPAASVAAVADRGPGEQQRIANTIPVKPGIENIRATLPQLLPAQQDDVAKAETQFAKTEGYGMLFTNGTGTGKTFTGLGILKRMQRQGKDNILIVVPDDKIAADWIDAGGLLDLPMSLLPDTKTAGTGIVITSYANLGQNDELASRKWDAVLADEAHSLMQSADGKVTTFLSNFRAITMHPDGVYQRRDMQNREAVNTLRDLNERITERMKEGATVAELAPMEARASALAKGLAEKLEAVKTEVAATQGHARPRAVFLSATPFAYEKTLDWANGYLFDYETEFPRPKDRSLGYNEPDSRQQFYITHLGYRMRYGKLTEPDASKVDRGMLQRQLNGWMKKRGSLSGRMLDVAADYDRRFVLVNSAIGNKIDDALQYLSDAAREQHSLNVADNENADHGPSQLKAAIEDKFDYLSRRFLLEAIKATEVIPLVREHMKLGRKVVVFHDYKKGGGFNPFDVPLAKVPVDTHPTELEKVTRTVNNFNKARNAFRMKFMDLATAPLGDMPSPIQVFKREIPDVLLVNGDEKKSDLLKRYKAFQSDDTGPQVMLVQSAKNKGWSGHDTTGKHQRVLINLGQPTAPTLSVQQEGRIYRTGQVSDAIMRYLNTGTNWEKWAFATTIAQRASEQENLGTGEQARALKDSFIRAFEESDAYPPGHEGEGKGGKELDRQSNDIMTEFDRAKTHYWAQQKKTSRTKAQEGTDYFATPEPIGLKMVQFLDPRGGEDLLEPSGGHGAIARWMPETTKRTAVEPSAVLRSRLAMVMQDGDYKVVDDTFENLNVVNKFDGIAMNPPFGVGGKTAVEHLHKASTHLRDGGRIVAIIPTGPMADKRFDQWFHEEAERPARPILKHPEFGDIYRGDTITSRSSFLPGHNTGLTVKATQGAGVLVVEVVDSNGRKYDSRTTVESLTGLKPTGPRKVKYRPAAGLYLVADIKLPSVTFERAGTGVMTRLLVIEKQADEKKPAPQQRSQQDLTSIDDINALFDRMEDMAMPPRLKPDATEAENPREAAREAREAAKAQAATAQPAAAVPGPKQAPAAGSKTVTIGGNPYEVTTYTTNGGKVLTGAWIDSGEGVLAKQLDQFTWKKAGKGWFVREKNFPKQSAALARTPDTARMSVPVTPPADGLFARGAEAPAGIQAPKLRLMLAQAARRMNLDLRVVETPAGLPVDAPTDARAYYDGATGTVYVVASNAASREDALKAMTHEAVAHLGLRELLGEKEHAAMMARISASDSPAIAELRDIVRRTYVDGSGQFNLSPEEFADEVAALAVERGVDADGNYRPGFAWVKDLLARVASWIRSMGVSVAFTNAELQGMLVRSQVNLERGPATATPREAGAFARRHEQTDTPAFRRWFGDSKVVDADGNPLVVYHGTGGDFDTFDLKHFGRTDGGARGLGFYFAAQAAYAGHVADDVTAGGLGAANVMPVYLSAKNPAEWSAELQKVRSSMTAEEFSGYLRKQGYDSVVTRRVTASDEWMVLDAKQIKSAIGNSGAFDGSNPDIRFARRHAPTLSEVTQTLKTAVQPLGDVNLWDRTIGTQYHKATKDRDFKRVFDAFVRQTDDTAHYAIEAESKAPSILMRIDSVREALKATVQSGKQQKEDLRAVSRALFANIEGEEGVKSIRYDDDSLRIIFGLTPKQIEMYNQARAAVDTSVERLAQTYAAQMGADQGMDITLLRDMDLADTVAAVKEHIQARHDEQRAAAALAADVQAEEGEGGPDVPRAPSKAETARQLQRLDDMEAQTEFLQESGYMPAMRFGQFAVTVRSPELEGGEVQHFEMFETRWEANIAAARLQKEYPSSTVEKAVMNPEQYAMFKGVSPETVELFARFTGADKNEAVQEYIAMAKSARSVMKRQLKRKGIAGFSQDATRVLASFLTSNARQSAVNMNVSEVNAALASKDLARKGDVQREAQKLADYMNNPIEEARRLRGFMFMHFMGGSVASALVNLTQPILQTAPYLHQFTGAKTAGIVARAAKMAATGVIDDPELAQAAKRARSDGITEPHEIHQLMADAGSSTFGNNLRARAAVKLWASMFSTSEAFNRRTTFLAAYQVGKAVGKEDPYDFARRAVIETQGLYSKANRPNWARGAVGATIFTFKQFSIAYLEWFSRLPKREKAIALAILVLAAGSEGLPFADDVEDLIDTIGQSMGYNTNSKKAKRKLLQETFGDTLGEILHTGLASKSGVDVSGRLGLGNLLPATAAFKPSETDKAKSIGELAGPIAGILQSAQKAIQKAQQGDWLGRTGAAAQLAPVAVRNAFAGADMLSTGTYKDSRGYKVADVTAWESFAKMLGLQPESIARQSARFGDEMQDKAMVTMMEAAIADRWAAGVADQDPAGIQAARETLREWNEKNPDSRIVIKPQQIASRVKKMRETRDERFLRTVPKELRQAASRELGR